MPLPPLLLVVMAMKMETVLPSPCRGIVTGITEAREGDMLTLGTVLAAVRPLKSDQHVTEEDAAWSGSGGGSDSANGNNGASASLLSSDGFPSSSPWDKGVEERRRLAALAVTMGGEAALAKHRARGRTSHGDDMEMNFLTHCVLCSVFSYITLFIP